MTRLVRFLLISLLAFGAVGSAKACWPDWYTPGGYYMYRVYEAAPEDFGVGGEYRADTYNCRAWQALTSKDIPLRDIYEVVYKMSLEEFELMYDHRKEHYDNAFAEWITKRDTEAMEFLLLAKTNEYIRLKRNSRWYYPSMKIGARMSLEEVAEKALTTQSKRLRDRYLLQGVRALFTLARYQECIDLWENEVVKLPEGNLMRQLILSYIAGAEFHVGNTRQAIALFAEIGDVSSMLYCMGREGEQISNIDALFLVCEHNSRSAYIPRALQEYVRMLEPSGNYFSQFYDEPAGDNEDLDKLYSLSLNMAKKGPSSTQAMWYYTAAFLSDLKGDPKTASKLLTQTTRIESSSYMKESIMVLRMYLDSKLSTYDAAYEKRLFEQLKWLDDKLVHNLTDEVREATSHGYKLPLCESYYYWNDMMRRILLAEVCPRMLAAGHTTRALQLANMASNRMLGVVDQQSSYYYDKADERYKPTTISMEEYRYSAKHYNDYDYRSHFFEMIDSIGLDAAIAYVGNVHAPKSAFDKFLNARGYINDDYLYDILGTQCLRHMRYREAVEYLGKVSKQYQYHHNVYTNYDPFVLDPYLHFSGRPSYYDDDDFRYRFAREMHSLEQDISTMQDSNRKAQMMVRYAIGIKNSFERCWALTQYYAGSSYYGQVCEKRDWTEEPPALAARERTHQVIELACSIATDEAAADIHYQLCNFKTIALQYPDTRKGRLVRGECDNLYDYHAHKVQYVPYYRVYGW